MHALPSGFSWRLTNGEERDGLGLLKMLTVYYSTSLMGYCKRSRVERRSSYADTDMAGLGPVLGCRGGRGWVEAPTRPWLQLPKRLLALHSPTQKHKSIHAPTRK